MLGVAAGLALAFVAATGCSADLSPEDEIRALLRQAIEDYEAGDVSALMDLVAEDYRDRRGRDRRQLERILRVFVLRGGLRHALARVETISFPEQGGVRVEAVVALARADLTSFEELARSDASLARVELDLRREKGGAFRVASASWREIAAL